MISLTASFSTPLENRVYWHDHLGLCTLLRMSKYTHLDDITLTRLRPNSRINQFVEWNLDEVYRLPFDYSAELVEVPHCRHISQSEKILMNQALRQTHNVPLALAFYHQTFFLESAAYGCLGDLKQRDKVENHTIRDENPMYKTAARLFRNAQVFFELEIIKRKTLPQNMADFAGLAAIAVAKAEEAGDIGLGQLNADMVRSAQHNLG